ncbi:MAG: DsrE family protein [Clostridium sp.]|uniref:DsrE family protein n=1 Tax=Clostridium TaxID=1485 RepID=UPI002153531F|nr:DsrE family protein [Clostridium sp. LY3-2]MCR6516222.1 DsrE family protein [Clostridium sp. LY3-2]
MKVILHVNENDHFKIALGNIKNLLSSGEQVQIELLVHNDPIRFLTKDFSKESHFIEALEDISEKGVVIAACNNTLNNLNIRKEDLLDFITIVPAGVLELIKKQEEGFAYVKP